MSISGISSSTNAHYQDPMSQLQSVRQDFSSLTTSLASGDLTGAQNAFATLMQDLGGNTSAQSGQQTGAPSQLDTDLTTLGNALNSSSGDLTAAQKAFATLLQDLKAGGLHHHHHHHTGRAQNTTGSLDTDLTTLGNALQSGDLTGAQNAFATLLQDLGKKGTQSTTATNSTDAQSAANGQSSATSSLVDTLQTTNGTSQNGTASSVSTLIQALRLYAQVGLNLSLPATGLLSLTG